MKIKPEWEDLINGEKEPYAARMRVFGGWVVRSSDYYGSDTELMTESSVFVPDLNHEWEIEYGKQTPKEKGNV